MRLTKIFEVANALAPLRLSGEICAKYGAYDNSGILLDCGEEITKILFALDCNTASAQKAKEWGAQLLITHHPAIYTPIKSLSHDGEGAAVLACAKAGISILSMHLNLDCAKGGIDEEMMRALGGEVASSYLWEVDGGAYGRIFARKAIQLNDFAEEMKKNFQTEKIICYGNRPVQKIASFCGAGMDEESISFALERGADTFVSADAKHHFISTAIEGGMNVVLLPHYAAEYYGFYQFYLRFQKESSLECSIFQDERFL